MLAEVNRWVAKFGPRTAFGNIMEKRYLGDATYVKNAASEAERKKLLALVKLFETYSKQYNVDYLLMAALWLLVWLAAYVAKPRYVEDQLVTGTGPRPTRTSR